MPEKYSLQIPNIIVRVHGNREYYTSIFNIFAVPKINDIFKMETINRTDPTYVYKMILYSKKIITKSRDTPFKEELRLDIRIIKKTS